MACVVSLAALGIHCVRTNAGVTAGVVPAERGGTIINPLAHSIAETCVLARAGRTAIYESINSGELIAHKRGKRTLIFANDPQRWLDSLPQIEVKCPVERGAVLGTRKGRGVA